MVTIGIARLTTADSAAACLENSPSMGIISDFLSVPSPDDLYPSSDGNHSRRVSFDEGKNKTHWVYPSRLYDRSYSTGDYEEDDSDSESTRDTAASNGPSRPSMLANDAFYAAFGGMGV